ncbi:MAG: bifunctional chorismate mutase/prephenate dehydrogenase [Myxococcales bacterium]
MKKSTPKPPALSDLRAEIDEIDHEVLSLLARRMRVVEQVAAVKKQDRVAIRDYQRERQLLDDRTARAEQLGLAPGPIESIYRQIMLASRDYQASLGAATQVEVETRDVAIIGGKGEMGTLMARMFSDLGHRVVVADLDTDPTPRQAAAAADVVVISVPIDVTEEVVADLGRLLRPDALLMDITSLKQAPMAAMLEATRDSGASVLGTHPMFGPGVHSLQGQRFVVCRGRGDAWHDWLIKNLDARGLVVTEATAQEHDRAMALVQVLTHFQTQVLGLSLARIGISLEESRRFTSPAYLMELYIAARHFGQDPQLYGPIEMLNPETARVTRAFREAATELGEILEQRDQARFDAVFDDVRKFFGDFTTEATEQSSFLIDRLVERSMG